VFFFLFMGQSNYWKDHQFILVILTTTTALTKKHNNYYIITAERDSSHTFVSRNHSEMEKSDKL